MKLDFKKIYFTTLAINRFVSVFKDFPETNFIILDSFKYLVDNKNIEIYSFIIMRDHVHMVWKIENESIIIDFKKHTGRVISNYLDIINKEYLNNFTSIRKDRENKIWKQSYGHIRIVNKKMLIDRINYIHNNPTKGDYKSVDIPYDYYFSSARAYATEESNFIFLKVINIR